jgi:hypothetical protein
MVIGGKCVGAQLRTHNSTRRKRRRWEETVNITHILWRTTWWVKRKKKKTVDIISDHISDLPLPTGQRLAQYALRKLFG